MKDNIKSLARGVAATAVLLTLLVMPAVGQAEDDGGWSYNITPFIFALGLDGDVATLPPAAPAEVDVPFGDILEELDIALMGVGEARKGKFAILGELFYSRISVDADTPGPYYSGADYDQTLFFVSAGASYRFVEKGNGHLDLLAGLRYWSLDNKFKLDAGLSPAKRVTHKEKWFDPILGIKGYRKLVSNWYVSGWAVAAVGGESDTAFDVFGGVGYQI